MESMTRPRDPSRSRTATSLGLSATAALSACINGPCRVGARPMRTGRSVGSWGLTERPWTFQASARSVMQSRAVIGRVPPRAGSAPSCARAGICVLDLEWSVCLYGVLSVCSSRPGGLSRLRFFRPQPYSWSYRCAGSNMGSIVTMKFALDDKGGTVNCGRTCSGGW